MALETIASFMALNKVVHDRAIYGKQYKLTKTCQCIHARLKRAVYKHGSLVAWRVYSASKRTLSILKDSNLAKLKTRGMHFGEKHSHDKHRHK